FLGMASFALATALGFLVYWGGDLGLSLEMLAVPLALAGVPVLATGLLLHRGLAEDNDLALVRTTGPGLALVGLLLLVLALVLAWPQPLALIPVCLLDFAVLTAVGF